MRPSFCCVCVRAMAEETLVCRYVIVLVYDPARCKGAGGGAVALKGGETVLEVGVNLAIDGGVIFTLGEDTCLKALAVQKPATLPTTNKNKSITGNRERE